MILLILDKLVIGKQELELLLMATHPSSASVKSRRLAVAGGGALCGNKAGLKCGRKI